MSVSALSSAPPFMASGGSFGAMLRGWREHRRYRQMELALEVEISARHLSFIENDRSRASREMILRLAEFLDIPFRERNDLLIAAGHAPEYGTRSLTDSSLSEVRRAVGLMLSSLEPCPALAVDRRWNLVEANRPAKALLAGVPAELLRGEVNVLRVSLHPRGLASQILNLSEWHAYVLGRLRRDIAMTGDRELQKLLTELESYVSPNSKARAPSERKRSGESNGELPVLVPFRLRTPVGDLSFVSTTTVFGSALDVTVSEMAIESFLPADDATAEALKHLMPPDS
jgi:transcriptional regulator with XRE-family HTH domain